ncbi:MAG: NAD(P)/FAD-dependent oxidoreductase [Pseudomonadota bacterium]
MSVQNLNIAFIGAGPAGLSAALFLNRSEHAVTVFDQFQEPQPLGSGLMLQQTGLEVLRRLNLLDQMHSLGRRVTCIRGFEAGSKRSVLDVRYTALHDENYALAVHRGALFNLLHQAVLADGIPIVPGAEIVEVNCQAKSRPVLVSKDGRPFDGFDLVVDASGANSTVRDQSVPILNRHHLSYGALWATLETVPGDLADGELLQCYRRASKMIGVLPVGQTHESSSDLTTFFWSLKVADYDDWRQAGLDVWKDEVRALWPEVEPYLDQIVDPDQLVLARYSHHTVWKPWHGRLVLIGDSAHATSPQLGQGANMALLDALVLSEALSRSSSIEEGLSGYALRRRRHLQLFQALSRMFTPFYQSDSVALPFIRNWLAAPLLGVPPVPRLLAHMISGTLINPFHDGQLDFGHHPVWTDRTSTHQF